MKKLKRFVCALLAAITIFGTLPTAAFAATRGSIVDDSGMEIFDDVNSNDWCYSAVNWAYQNNITSGIGGGLFGRNSYVTRAQVVTFLYAYRGRPEYTNTSFYYDVNPGEYFYDAVMWATEKGITSGTGGNTFSPNQICTIPQVITMLYADAGRPSVSECGSSWGVDSREYYHDAAAWSLYRDITRFVDNDENGNAIFSKKAKFPTGNCNRAVFVTLLYASAIEDMVATAENETNNSSLWNHGMRYGGGGGKLDYWCAAFVSWCGMMNALADRDGYTYHSETWCSWASKVFSYSYHNPILRHHNAADMCFQFLEKKQMYLSNYFCSCDAWNNRAKERYGAKTDNAQALVKSFDPRRGDIVFFTYFENGKNFVLDQDYLVSHVGIVTGIERVNTFKVWIYTVEGNSGDKVKTKAYLMDMNTGAIVDGDAVSDYGKDMIVGFGRIQ